MPKGKKKAANNPPVEAEEPSAKAPKTKKIKASCCSDAKSSCCSPSTKSAEPTTKKSVSFPPELCDDDHGSFIEKLPPTVQTRIKALQQLQNAHGKHEQEFVKELRILEKKYHALYEPLYEKRSKIVKGECEPAKEDLPSEDQKTYVPQTPDGEGIPEFWLTVLQKHPVLADMITERDLDALKHLVDIKLIRFDQKLRLEFFFNENPYFTDSVLVKTYYFEQDPETGEESGSKIEGTPIHWKTGSELNEKFVKKKIKQKGKVKLVNKKEPCDTFFNFFNPKNVPEGLNDEDDVNSNDELLIQLVEQDFEIGNLFKHTIIPNAVKWFTGELTFDDYDDMSFDDEASGESNSEDDDDEDGEEGATDDKSAAPSTTIEKPPECKQQ
jgi:nucleosome assembly protein 1-like 1